MPIERLHIRRKTNFIEYRKLSLPPLPLNNHPLDISKIDTFGFAHDDLLTPASPGRASRGSRLVLDLDARRYFSMFSGRIRLQSSSRSMRNQTFFGWCTEKWCRQYQNAYVRIQWFPSEHFSAVLTLK